MEKCTIFYSWQSDLPNNLNRGFIEEALERAAKSIRNDDSIQIEPVIDRDTAGVPGSPDIASTIFSKINQAQIFVCDVSIINHDASTRLAPNPNVLIELGYAIKTLGAERIIMVMNTSFGAPDNLPFDLKMKRVITYNASQEQQSRSQERKELEAKLENGLRTILVELEKQTVQQSSLSTSTGEEARAAIENVRPNQVVLVRKFMAWLNDELAKIAPEFPDSQTQEEPDELLVQALDKTTRLVTEFANLTEIISIMNASEACQSIYKCFTPTLDLYVTPQRFSGSYRQTRLDFYKFIGHELFTILIAALIQEKRWELITNILEEEIYVNNEDKWRSHSVSFESISFSVELLKHRNHRLQTRRISLHADLLHKRHSEGDLSKTISSERFVEADFFLFLRNEKWRPWSGIYMGSKTPRFISAAVNKNYAQSILLPLKIDTVDTLRSRVVERVNLLGRFWGEHLQFPLEYFNPQTIGSK